MGTYEKNSNVKRVKKKRSAYNETVNMEKGNGENQSKREEIMGNRHTKNGDTEYGIRNMENGIWR